MLDPEILRRMGGAAAAAAELAVAVLVGVFGGAWLDTRFGTSPVLLLSLSLAGLLVGLVRLTRWLKSSESQDDDDPRHDRR